ncbi:hypothetical protein OXB_2548 [Bacillus sp. OxB-1]|uniref:DUF1033 family protein n=1 Tax=Bacillus sp. (strain OxB-1) TaxID=98228 RepID=UPI000581FE70|nr:DUF1033 family protein [Bacillus sp. OxB-1]BAQ11019.1 hypothetical protein OXB_2548 [Bacillus sp. OxB-1]
MYEVIYMKADYEPWWMFEGWEEKVRHRQSFDNSEEATDYFERLLHEFRGKYENEAVKKEVFYAFWTEREKVFCEGCDEDLQVYHGIMLLLQKEGGY